MTSNGSNGGNNGSNASNNAGASDSMGTISSSTFVTMLDELQLISGALTKHTALGIYKRALTLGIRSSVCHHALDYDQFLEALVVLAIHRRPDPYVPLHARVQEFIFQGIILPLFHKRRISTSAIPALDFVI